MTKRDIEHWRESQDRAAQPLPWWLWPVSLLWKRTPVQEVGTIPVAVPKFHDTVPLHRQAK